MNGTLKVFLGDRLGGIGTEFPASAVQPVANQVIAANANSTSQKNILPWVIGGIVIGLAVLVVGGVIGKK